MNLIEKETETEFILTKEKPYRDLINLDSLWVVTIFFGILYIINFLIIIPILIFLCVLASLQTLEDNFKIVINKETKEFYIYKYYMGSWKLRVYKYKAESYSAVQIEKQVTSIKENQRFSINLLTEPSDSEKKGTSLKILKNIELEDTKYAKIISWLLELVYETKIKYKSVL